MAKGKAGDVRAGGGFYEIYAKDGLSGVLEQLKGRVLKFSAFLRGTGAGLMGAGAGLGAGPLAFLLGGTNRAAETARLADQFRVPIAVMNRLKYAADQAGVSVGEVMSDTTGRFRGLLNSAPALDAGAARQAVQVQRDFRDATLALQNAMLPLLKHIAPLVTQFTEFVQANAAGVRVVAGFAAGLTLAGGALVVVGSGLAAAVVSVKALGAAIAFVLSPLGALLAAGAGLGALFVTQTDRGKQGFEELRETATTAWSGIVAAVSRGNLELAFEVVTTALKLEWKKVVLYWTETVEDFGAFFRNLWEDVINWVRFKLADLEDAARDAANFVVDEVTGGKTAPSGVGDTARAQAAAEEAARKARQKAERDAATAPIRAEIEAAKQRLAGLVAAAVAAPAVAGKARDVGGHDYLATRQMIYEATKGAFNVASAAQQFGYGSQATQNELSRQMLEELRVMAAKTGKEVLQNLRMR